MSDSVFIEVLSVEHGIAVIQYFKSIGVRVGDCSGHLVGNYYGYCSRKRIRIVGERSLDWALNHYKGDVKTLEECMVAKETGTVDEKITELTMADISQLTNIPIHLIRIKN